MQRKILLLGLITTIACAGEQSEPPAQPISVADVGFETPESVLHDAAADVYLISNINGSPLEKDDNGFISRVAPDGSVIALRWIDGSAPDVTLNAPKGMALKGDTLFVTDIDIVRMFDRTTGASLGERAVPDATFLNDMAVGPDGRVYVTDSGLQPGPEGFAPSGTDAVWRFDDEGNPEPLVRGEALGRPNGIVVDEGRVLMVSFGSGEVTFVDTATGLIQGVPKPPGGQLDGVVRTRDGAFLISSWESQAVYRMAAGGQYEVAVDSVEAPADIGYDSTRNRLLIPLFMGNRVEIVPLQ